MKVISAFTEAILVTPMGALSVVVCAIMSHFFLKESLTFFVCLLCVLTSRAVMDPNSTRDGSAVCSVSSARQCWPSTPPKNNP
jgi:hypothetical protein